MTQPIVIWILHLYKFMRRITNKISSNNIAIDHMSVLIYIEEICLAQIKLMLCETNYYLKTSQFT